jgi:hypothetical protein
MTHSNPTHILKNNLEHVISSIRNSIIDTNLQVNVNRYAINLKEQLTNSIQQFYYKNVKTGLALGFLVTAMCVNAVVENKDLSITNLMSTINLPTLSYFFDENDYNTVQIDNKQYYIETQPPDNVLYISPNPDTFTIYSLARKQGIIALLAHDFLAGRDLETLQLNNVITMHGKFKNTNYKLIDIIEFQAEEPLDPNSRFLPLKSNINNGVIMAAADVFNLVYTIKGQLNLSKDDHLPRSIPANYLIFQTCLPKNGKTSWGRVFYIFSSIAR